MATVLILGAGFSGATAAHLLSKRKHQVTVLEKNSHPGGGCWTRFYGKHPYTFGPRVFFTWDEKVFKQLVSLIGLSRFYAKTWTYVEEDAQLFHYPIQQEDLKLMKDYKSIRKELQKTPKKDNSSNDFETYWLSTIGPTLYRKFVDSYSKKMWGIGSNRELVVDFEWVNKGTPIRHGDNRLYTDQFQGYPKDREGYNKYFMKCLAQCKIVYDCCVNRFDPERMTVYTTKGSFQADIIINTIHVDTLFGYQYGKLKFCGRDLLTLMLPVEHAFPKDVTWIHYSGLEPFTRVTEFKKITGHRSGFTLLGIEIPSENNRLYPVQSKPEILRYEQYKTLFPDNFYSIGRLGTFKYKGIQDAIRDAMDVSKVVS